MIFFLQNNANGIFTYVRTKEYYFISGLPYSTVQYSTVHHRQAQQRRCDDNTLLGRGSEGERETERRGTSDQAEGQGTRERTIRGPELRLAELMVKR